MPMTELKSLNECFPFISKFIKLLSLSTKLANAEISVKLIRTIVMNSWKMKL